MSDEISVLPKTDFRTNWLIHQVVQLQKSFGASGDSAPGLCWALWPQTPIMGSCSALTMPPPRDCVTLQNLWSCIENKNQSEQSAPFTDMNMGPFSLNQSNHTHQLSDPKNSTWPNQPTNLPVGASNSWTSLWCTKQQHISINTCLEMNLFTGINM